jgi:hypothetical protein
MIRLAFAALFLFGMSVARAQDADCVALAQARSTPRGLSDLIRSEHVKAGNAKSSAAAATLSALVRRCQSIDTNPNPPIQK